MTVVNLISESRENAIVDVVFIHGLGGHPHSTWEWKGGGSESGETNFWPKELASDLPSSAIWSVGYDSSPTKWFNRNMPLLDRANSLLDVLDANDIGSRPIVFITHSLGGLLAKALVRASVDMPENDDKHQVHLQTRGFVFFSTPHTGSSIANLARAIPGVRPAEILNELAQNDAYLRDLAFWSVNRAHQSGHRCLTYFEAYKTLGFTVVDPTSANPGWGTRPVPFDADHFSICKIPHNSDPRYKQVLKFVSRIIEELAPQKVQAQPFSAADGVDFEIGVLPNPPLDGRVVEHHPRSRTLTYLARSSPEAINIAADIPYVRNMENGAILGPTDYFWNPFKCQFPSLDVMLVNNSAKTLVLSEASIEVVSSCPDSRPVIVIPSNTSEMKLQIRNEGWCKISNTVLRCNLLPTNARGYMPDPPIEHIEIGNSFSHEFNLGDFAEAVELDLRESLKALGVDIDAIEKSPMRSQQMFALHAMQAGEDVAMAKHMGRFPDMESDKAWAPFPDGYVVVAGLLEFDAPDASGAERHYTIPIRARVFMFNVRMDLPMPPSYQYSAELEPDGKEYRVVVKLSQVLKAGEADRFIIRLACSQSACHEFFIDWRFVGGLSLRSHRIRLQHFVPRTFANESGELVKNSEFDPEQSEIVAVFQGDCVEQSLRMAMAVAAARAGAPGAVEE